MNTPRTTEQRLELAIAYFDSDRIFGTSSTALIGMLVRGGGELTDSGKWLGLGMRPSDAGDCEGNIRTLGWLPAWAKPQAARIIAESIALVDKRYLSDERRAELLALVAVLGKDRSGVLS